MRLKSIIVVFATLFALDLLVTGCGLDSYTKSGAEKYYARVTDKEKKVGVEYQYKVASYNQSGQKSTLKFNSKERLSEGILLVLYVKEGRGVTNYNEVKESKIPVKAKEKLDGE